MDNKVEEKLPIQSVGQLSGLTQSVGQSPIGLTFIQDAISLEEETKLLNFINLQPWSNVLKRQVQQYGYSYDYVTKKISDEKTPEIPKIFRQLIKKFSLNANQIIVNKYDPGQGISAHTDNCIFGDTIATLSLNSGAYMDFAKNQSIFSVYLTPCSLAIMKDDARYEYTHCIPSRKADIVNGIKYLRDVRISVTFRKYEKK